MRENYYYRVILFLKSIFILVIGLAAFRAYPAEKIAPDSKKPLFTWDLLWTGSWTKSFNTAGSRLDGEMLYSGGTLVNRGELTVGVPGLFLDFRFQFIDKRKLPAGDNDYYNPGFGIYFNGTGNSRLLYGVLDEYGLSARIKNMWAKSPPYAEYRKPSIRDLKTDPSSSPPDIYLYFGFPRFGFFSGYASVQTGSGFFPDLGCGLEFCPDKNTSFLLEGFYTQQVLQPRMPQTWFSASPPLPERDFRFLGLGTNISLKNFGLAADIAFSDTFAYGRDFYGNAALRISGKPGISGFAGIFLMPWKFSMAIEGSGIRYVGRDGSIPGSGFRAAGRLETSWVRSGLFRFDASFRSSGIGESFYKGSLYAYYRPSAPKGKSVPPFRISRASLYIARNAAEPLKTDDSLTAVLGFNFNVFRFVLTGNLDCKTALENDSFNIGLPPFFDRFESSKISLETAWSFYNIGFNFKTGYLFNAVKDNVWDFSLNSSVKFSKIGRISLIIAASDFPLKWNYTVSWRMGKFSF